MLPASSSATTTGRRSATSNYDNESSGTPLRIRVNCQANTKKIRAPALGDAQLLSGTYFRLRGGLGGCNFRAVHQCAR